PRRLPGVRRVRAGGGRVAREPGLAPARGLHPRRAEGRHCSPSAARVNSVSVEGTRERLLTEARDLYLEVGVEFSLREVARRAGVSAPAVYRHFENKDQLLRAVCAEGFQLFASYLMLALEAGGPKQRLVATTKQYLHFGLEHPRDYRVLFMGEPSALEFAPKKERAPTYQFLVDRVRESDLAGDPDETAI